jgi:transposase InsO family protein
LAENGQNLRTAHEGMDCLNGFPCPISHRQCRLSDEVSYPKLTPTKITTKERRAICDLVTSKKYLHFSIRIRIYSAKPKFGIRASAPNQIWHLDQSLLRLKNGTKVFIRAVVDNFSRCVLSWQVTDGYGGKLTKALVEDACQRARASSRHSLRKWTSSKALKSRPERRDGSRTCPLPADSVLHRTVIRAAHFG